MSSRSSRMRQSLNLPNPSLYHTKFSQEHEKSLKDFDTPFMDWMWRLAEHGDQPSNNELYTWKSNSSGAYAKHLPQKSMIPKNFTQEEVAGLRGHNDLLNEERPRLIKRRTSLTISGDHVRESQRLDWLFDKASTWAGRRHVFFWYKSLLG